MNNMSWAKRLMLLLVIQTSFHLTRNDTFRYMAKEKYKSIPKTYIITEEEKELLKECNDQQLLLYNKTNWVYSQRQECNIVLLQTLNYFNIDNYHKVQFQSLTEEINKGRITSAPYSVLAVHSDLDMMI